jgi:hypothetical protein
LRIVNKRFAAAHQTLGADPECAVRLGLDQWPRAGEACLPEMGMHGRRYTQPRRGRTQLDHNILAVAQAQSVDARAEAGFEQRRVNAAAKMQLTPGR